MLEPLEDLSETGLRAAHRYQRRIIADGDGEAFARFLHPNFTINAPNNICGARDQILRLFQGDAFARENCQSQIEKAALTGNVGVLMGNEIVTPGDGSLLAAWFGKQPIRRRFTDVYLFEEGKWSFLARQASVVREPNKFGS